MAQGNTTAPVTARGRYVDLSSLRSPFLERARKAATVTIPGLLPPEGASGSTTLYQPFQSVGARGVNNLASKLMLVLFPPGSTFVRMKMEQAVEDKVRAQFGDDGVLEFEEALSRVEQAVVDRLELAGARTHLFEFLKHLLVAGNGLLQILPKGKIKFYPMDRYVVKRDLDGEVLDIVIEERLSRKSLPKRLKKMLAETPDSTDKSVEDKTVPLYTWVYRENAEDSWKVCQQFEDKTVPGSMGTFPKDESAFIAGRWSSIPGQDWGRGFCEEHLGDLLSLESLKQSIVEFASAVSKIVMFFKDSGETDKEAVQNARSGALLDGRAEDISILMIEKTHDFSVAKATHDEIKSGLEGSFLSASSIQRNAERVTAEEIRFMAGELEQSLGGTYSILSQELQLPLVRRYLRLMQNEGVLPEMPKDTVMPQIVTGLDGLGRSSDMMKLDLLLGGMGQLFGPEELAKRVKIHNYGRRRALALGIEVNDIFLTDEEVAQQEQAAALQAVAPQLVDAMAGAAQQTPPTEEQVG